MSNAPERDFISLVCDGDYYLLRPSLRKLTTIADIEYLHQLIKEKNPQQADEI